MASVIDAGTARNITNDVLGEHLTVNAAEKRFVTFVNDLGGIHTIIVDVEHAAKDADELIKWFEHTRALVTASGGVAGQPNHTPPEKVLATANERMGFHSSTDEATTGTSTGDRGEAG